jgi:hypothetical protein
MRTIWQVGAGMSGSPYHELLIKHGLALIGPGDPGKWTSDRSDEDFDGGWVRRFATEPQAGDVVLLRIGSDRVVAVGIIASEYEYLEQFDDVHGWDLQHSRRVRWRVLPSPQVFPSRVFGANSPRFARVNSEEVIRFANEVMAVELDAWQSAPLPSLPPPEAVWDSPPQWLNGLIGLAQDWSRMIWQEQRFRGLPSEDEMLVHFVIPFFRGMGWPQELLAVKWNYVDLAVFRSLPRLPENCCLVVEAKRLGIGAESALQQAVDYSKKLPDGCDVLLTDGFRYRLYGGAGDFQPIAYANLLALKASGASLLERLYYRPNAVPSAAGS